MAALVTVTLIGTTAKVNAGPNDSDWVAMFNGKDLKDWEMHFTGHPLDSNYNNTFRVDSGYLLVDYSQYKGNWAAAYGTPWGHLGYKQRSFSYYLLRAEYQAWGKQVAGGPSWAVENNGLMLHSQKVSTMGVNQDYPISIESQLLGGGNGTSTMNVCTPGSAIHLQPTGAVDAAHCLNAKAINKKVEWMKVSALVLGDSIIRNYVRDTLVFTYYHPVQMAGAVIGNTVPIKDNTPMVDGYITIQAESAPYRFKKIEILDLAGCKDASSPNYKAYVIKSVPSACQATVVANPGKMPGQNNWEWDASHRHLWVGFTEPYSISILSLTGQQLARFSSNTPKSFDLAAFHNQTQGLSLLTLSYRDKQYTQKVLLNNF
jgi:hypothetical protein